jgi:acetoin utilization protein AcuB
MSLLEVIMMGPVARQFMTPKPVYVEARSQLREALRKMQEHDLRHIAVLSEGNLVGIISDRDVRSYLLHSDEEVDFPERSKKRLETPVGALAQSDLIVIDTETAISEAIELLISQKIGALPVVDPHTQRLIGILSYVDILKAAQQFFEPSISAEEMAPLIA